MWPKNVIDYRKNFYVFSFITGLAVRVVMWRSYRVLIALIVCDYTIGMVLRVPRILGKSTECGAFFRLIGNAVDTISINCRPSKLTGDNALVYGDVEHHFAALTQKTGSAYWVPSTALPHVFNSFSRKSFTFSENSELLWHKHGRSDSGSFAGNYVFVKPRNTFAQLFPASGIRRFFAFQSFSIR